MAEKDKQHQPRTDCQSWPIAHAVVALGLWALLAVLMFHFADATSFLLLGGLAALALASTLQPLADRLPGPATVRAVGAVVLFVAGVAAVLVAVGYFMYTPIADNIEEWPRIRREINAQLAAAADALGANGQLTVEEIGDIAGELLTGGSTSKMIGNVASGMLTAILATVVIIIASMYLLAHPNGTLSGQAIRLFPKDRRKPTLDALEELRPLLRWWFIGTALSMAVVGTLFGAGYVMIGLQFAAPLALFAGVAQVVPTFGPMITLVLSLLVAIPQGSYQVGGVVVIYVGVQSVESYILTPKVMERAVHVPPVITLFTIILWGNVFGVTGLILAIPLNLMIWALLKHHIILRHERTEPGQDDQPSTKPAETQQT